MLVAALTFAAAPVSAQDEFKQVKLTEKQIKGYISAHPKMQGLLQKIDKAGDKPDKKLLAGLEDLAKKHGFASFEELDAVAATVSFMVTGFDQESGEFSEPRKALATEIAALKKDKSMPDKERKELIKELEDSVKTTPDVAHKSNIALVKKHLKKLEKID